jgi:hypothetical protein
MGLIAIAFENGFPKPFEILLVMPLQRIASSAQTQEPASSPARSGRAFAICVDFSTKGT